MKYPRKSKLNGNVTLNLNFETFEYCQLQPKKCSVQDLMRTPLIPALRRQRQAGL